MCFLYQKTTAAPHLAGAFQCPSTPGPHSAGPDQDASLLDLDRGDFISPWTLDEGERSCSPRPHDREAFRLWTPDQAGDFALPLDPHRAGPEGVPPSPAPATLAMSIEATVPPVDHGARRAVGKG
jgi:hypothetical protein